MILWQAWEYILVNQDRVLKNLFIHIQLSTLALVVAIAIAVPVGVILTRYRHAAFYVINAAALGRTIPGLAILALLLPIMGIGFWPALVALTLIAMPPILTNTYVGLTEVDEDSVEAARGMGMNTWELIRKIELPLVVPVVFTGIRTSAVQVFSSATLAAFIGGGGLGDFIMAGIAMNQNHLLLVGAIPVAVGALMTDWAFGGIERLLTPKGMRV